MLDFTKWTKRGKSVVQLSAILRPGIDVKDASGLIVRIGGRRCVFACSYTYTYVRARIPLRFTSATADS